MMQFFGSIRICQQIILFGPIGFFWFTKKLPRFSTRYHICFTTYLKLLRKETCLLHHLVYLHYLTLLKIRKRGNEYTEMLYYHKLFWNLGHSKTTRRELNNMLVWFALTLTIIIKILATRIKLCFCSILS